jgi:hypothetical protein
MLWTRNDMKIVARSSDTTPLMRRDENCVLLKLTKNEAIALIAEIANAFEVDGVPADTHNENICVVIENPTKVFPKEVYTNEQS